MEPSGRNRWPGLQDLARPDADLVLLEELISSFWMS